MEKEKIAFSVQRTALSVFQKVSVAGFRGDLESRGVYALIPEGLFNATARSFDSAPMLSYESTGAALRLTGDWVSKSGVNFLVCCIFSGS